MKTSVAKRIDSMDPPSGSEAWCDAKAKAIIGPSYRSGRLRKRISSAIYAAYWAGRYKGRREGKE